jgi:hypothetical protein
MRAFFHWVEAYYSGRFRMIGREFSVRSAAAGISEVNLHPPRLRRGCDSRSSGTCSAGFHVIGGVGHGVTLGRLKIAVTWFAIDLMSD